MSDLINESPNKKRALGRGLGSLLGGNINHSENKAVSSSGPIVGQQMQTRQNQQQKNVEKNNGSGLASQSLMMNNQKSTEKELYITNTAAAAVAEDISKGAQPMTSGVASAAIEGKVWQVAIDKIQSGEYQPRKNFKKESIEELATSIKAHGILQPIVVRRIEGQNRFEIVAGERRWRAAQAAGLHEVPVLIKSYDDRQSLELAIIENVQREDLDPIEEAEGYSRLATEFDLSHQQISEKVGKDRTTISNSLRLLLLPKEVRLMIQAGEISVGHAKVLLSLNDQAQQISFAKRINKEKISVRKLEKEIQQYLSPREKAHAIGEVDTGVARRLILGLSEELQKKLGTKVIIDYAEGKGKISIYFYSDDELSQLVENLKE